MNITPFKGYRYDASVVGDAGLCIAPPYDVIDKDQQQNLYDRSEYNIVRVTKGKTEPGDGDGNNVYSRAGETLEDFIAKGALKQDHDDSIYVYEQDFSVDGTTYRRSGFIALGGLEEYGGAVKPHEQTMAGPKDDRLSLMNSTKSQIGQIFMLYSDPEKTIDAILAQACKGRELLGFVDDDGVRHHLFAVTDPEQIETIKKVMSGKSVFIADGHHRYETSLNYYNETKNPAALHCMMTFVNTHNEGLIILPTHRLIKNVANFSSQSLIGKMKEYFDVARMKFGDMVEKKAKFQMMIDALGVEHQNSEHAFGMYFDDGAFYVATLRSLDVMAKVAGDKSQAWRQLDVSILHKVILEKMLGIDQAALTAQTNVEYIKDFGPATLNAMDKVDSGQRQGLFFLNTTSARDVESVAKEGEKMPQKSTFFYPKIYSGLVLNRL